MSESRPHDSWIWLGGTFILALGFYVGAYFLAVRPGGTVWFTPSGKKLYTLPSYGGLPPRIFAPIHYLDCTLIRPSFWSAGRVWTLTGARPFLLNQITVTNLTTNVMTGSAPH